mmetsp:Transcript_10578/g.34950  ORF Transcript_10578/g.34950 Transcript_10578/m.34950 type:complete len:561 (-) Transcript_10578:164-1846(-)
MFFARRARQVVSPLAACVGVSAAAWCEEEEVVNWSGTHSCVPSRVYAPETTAEAAAIVKQHHDRREPLRPCGSTLSPNGLGFCREGGAMLNMGLCDRILEVDEATKTVRVECGARVDQVLDALSHKGLTLENLASIAAQQIGGFVQVGAHGTGATLGPVDSQVLSLKMATPAYGVMEVRRGHPMFDLMSVSLGTMGVCLEATLRCVPKHLLRERVAVLTRAEAESQCADILRNNRHARFMWIPFVDAVVVVTNNPTFDGVLGEGQGEPPRYSIDERLEPLRSLLATCRTDDEDVSSLNFAQLRDELLKMDPLDVSHVKRVNAAEAEFWRRSQGVDVADSSKKLNFECGGQQWVNECAFPAGRLSEPSGRDVQYLLDLLGVIEAEGIPAPAPIEQRWTAASSAKLSPASSKKGEDLAKTVVSHDDLVSWVGIIMYLPTDDPGQRRDITDAFQRYKRKCEDILWPTYGAVEHWAKIELPTDQDHADRVRKRLADRFPTADFAVARKYFDPHGILSNDLIDTVLPRLPNADDSEQSAESTHTSARPPFFPPRRTETEPRADDE